MHNINSPADQAQGMLCKHRLGDGRIALLYRRELSAAVEYGTAARNGLGRIATLLKRWPRRSFHCRHCCHHDNSTAGSTTVYSGRRVSNKRIVLLCQEELLMRDYTDQAPQYQLRQHYV